MTRPDTRPVTETAASLKSEMLLYGLILGCTLLQKFTAPFTDRYISFSVCIMGLVLAAGIAFRLLEIQPVRLMFLLLMVGGLTLTQVLGPDRFSLLSLVYLFAVHLPYVFSLKKGSIRPLAAVLFFQKICVVISVMGVLQYFLQFLIGWEYAFFLDGSHFPQDLMIRGMNNLNETGYLSGVFKSNGFFLIEPSVTSQFLAIGLVAELVYFGNMKRILLYLLGIAVTFSGTGLMILASVGPVLLIRQRRFGALVMCGVGLLAVVLFSSALGLDTTTARIAEFSNQSTSGYARFISPFLQLERYIMQDLQTFLMGVGAGGSLRVVNTAELDYASYQPTWCKLILEYGVIGALAYMPLIVVVFLKSGRAPYLKAALLIEYFILGEYLVSPYVHPLIIALVAWPHPAQISAPPRTRHC